MVSYQSWQEQSSVELSIPGIHAEHMHTSYLIEACMYAWHIAWISSELQDAVLPSMGMQTSFPTLIVIPSFLHVWASVNK